MKALLVACGVGDRPPELLFGDRPASAFRFVGEMCCFISSIMLTYRRFHIQQDGNHHCPPNKPVATAVVTGYSSKLTQGGENGDKSFE